MTTDNPYLPFSATVRSVKELTRDVKLLAIEVPPDLAWEAGQFMMVSMLGAGEIPLSISSVCGADPDLEVCVRSVGRVSAAVNGLAAGDRVLLRGPYGRPFPPNEGRDTIFLCGGIGIVPLRPLINKTVAARSGAVTVIYGSRDTTDVLFMDEAAAWERQGAAVVLTVDVCRIDTWKGCTGLVTEHFNKANVDFPNGMAYLCGPPAMIRAAMTDLANLGMPDGRIVTTLEAHMKCGVGKCGHCFCGGKLICEEGPVFTFAEIKKDNIRPGQDLLGEQ